MKRRAGIFNTLREITERVARRFRTAPIDSGGEFRAFVSSRASLIAQKAAIDYCRGKTGAFSHALFTEAAFLNALSVCRWEAFAAALSDVLVIAEGMLRPYGAREALNAALQETYHAALAEYPLPEHRAESGWSDVEAEFAIRLGAASTAEPRTAVQVADHSARRLFETLPIHANMRTLDEEVVFGAVRFRMTAVAQEMGRRLCLARLAVALTGAGSAASGPP